MSGLTVCASGSDLPQWVVERGGQLGVRFVLPRTDEVLAAEVVAEQLAELGADGYLMNGPGYGPYVSRDLLDAAGGLRLVTYLGQSTEPAAYATFVDLSALAERGVPFTHAPAVPSSVAEGALALLLALNVGIVPAHTARKAGQRVQPKTRNGLRGSTLGIVGMGQIGRQVAELATAFGMRVTYYSRTRKPEIEEALDARFAELPQLFGEADRVSLHTPPGSSESLITADILAQAGGIDLIDTTSTAKVVDPDALLLALDHGWVAKAAIEGRYPGPYDQRLQALGDDRVLLLEPYTSWNTEQDRRAGWLAYLETLAALLDRRPLPYQLV